MLIRHRTHHASYRQTVKIIINKDQHTQQDRRKLRAHTALDVLAGPASERRGASRLVHQTDHDSKDYQKHKNAYIIAVRQHSYDTILEYMCDRGFKGESGIEDTSYQNSDK